MVVDVTKNSAVTELLGDWRSGDPGALDKLTPLVYDELRRLAHRYMHSERADHTLQATGLVNEAFMRLAGVEVPWENRTHFYAIAARLMRRILIDYAKAHNSKKRGSGVSPLILHENHISDVDTASQRFVELNDALDQLAEIDQRKSEVVVLNYFGGLTYEEIADSMSISPATVHRELRLAKAWLFNELEDR